MKCINTGGECDTPESCKNYKGCGSRAHVEINPGSDAHLLLIGAPQHFNLMTGENRKALLAFARNVWAAAQEVDVKWREQEDIDFDSAWPAIEAELPGHHHVAYTAEDVEGAEKDAAREAFHVGWKKGYKHGAWASGMAESESHEDFEAEMRARECAFSLERDRHGYKDAAAAYAYYGWCCASATLQKQEGAG